MSDFQADIDIDTNDRMELLKLVPHIKATLANGKKHPSGVYFQSISHDEKTNQATLPMDEAEAAGYIKIDILNLSMYGEFRDQQEFDDLFDREPDWSMLQRKEDVDKIIHISKHFDLVQKIAPRSIDDLALVLALIRPAKRHLLGKSRKFIDQHIWDRPNDDTYHFKKSHAYAYAMAIKVQMNMLSYQNQYQVVFDLLKTTK